MVSLNSEDIGKYILKNTNSSLLLKCFCAHLFGAYDRLSEQNLKELRQSRRDYKHIAAQGFCAPNQESEITSRFSEGLEWLTGRSFSDNDTIVFDNITLLGLIVGIQALRNSNRITIIETWIQSIIASKNTHPTQVHYETFFRNFLEGKIFNMSSLSLETELSIFNSFMQNKVPTPNTLINDYYLQMRTGSFPYYPDDFFRNMVNVYNENQIIKSYILNQEVFEEKLQAARKEEAEKALLPVKTALNKRAKALARLMFLVFILVITGMFIAVVYYVLGGDWNFLEPRTYLLGLPFLSYIFSGLFFLLFRKEFSLKPKIVINILYRWNQKVLYKRNGLSLPSASR